MRNAVLRGSITSRPSAFSSTQYFCPYTVGVTPFSGLAWACWRIWNTFWCLPGLWWDLPWRKGKWFPCNAAEGTLSERAFSKHSLSLLRKGPVIRLGFYFCHIAHTVTALSLLSLKQNSKVGDSHSGRSGNTLLISLKCTHTPCRQLSLLGNWRDVIWGVLSDSALIL